MRREIARKYLVAAVGLGAIFVVAVAYLYGAILDQSLTKRPDTVTVMLDETGGLFEKSTVTYRGIQVGTVDTIRLSPDGVVARIHLEDSYQIPSSSRAVVRTLSPAGEQFLDLQPTSTEPPYLADGSRIEATATMTPTTMAEALGNVDRLMGQIDPDDLGTVVRELSVAFSEPDDLRTLLAEGRTLIDTLDDNWPATERVLDNGATLLRTGNESKDEFEEFASSAKELSGWLRDYDPKLRDMLDKSPAQIADTQDLISVMSRTLPALFDRTISLTDIVAARDPHLRELLVQFPKGAATLADTLRNGQLNVSLFIGNGTVCQYDGMDHELAPPTATERHELDADNSCDASFSAQQRGAAHTPRPTR